jgi:D-alanyl-D-alanine carboxypeptidase
MAGRILRCTTVAGMTDALYPVFQEGMWYGLGLMVHDVPGLCGGTVWIGHSGGVPGVRVVLAYAPDRDAVVAVALTGEGSAKATANLLLSALEHD